MTYRGKKYRRMRENEIIRKGDMWEAPGRRGRVVSSIGLKLIDAWFPECYRPINPRKKGVKNGK